MGVRWKESSLSQLCLHVSLSPLCFRIKPRWSPGALLTRQEQGRTTALHVGTRPHPLWLCHFLGVPGRASPPDGVVAVLPSRGVVRIQWKDPQEVLSRVCEHSGSSTNVWLLPSLLLLLPLKAEKSENCFLFPIEVQAAVRRKLGKGPLRPPQPLWGRPGRCLCPLRDE